MFERKRRQLIVPRVLIVNSLHFMEKLFHHETTKFVLSFFRVFVFSSFRDFVIDFFFWFRLVRVKL